MASEPLQFWRSSACFFNACALFFASLSCWSLRLRSISAFFLAFVSFSWTSSSDIVVCSPAFCRSQSIIFCWWNVSALGVLALLNSPASKLEQTSSNSAAVRSLVSLKFVIVLWSLSMCAVQLSYCPLTHFSSACLCLAKVSWSCDCRSAL